MIAGAFRSAGRAAIGAESTSGVEAVCDQEEAPCRRGIRDRLPCFCPSPAATPDSTPTSAAALVRQPGRAAEDDPSPPRGIRSAGPSLLRTMVIALGWDSNNVDGRPDTPKRVSPFVFVPERKGQGAQGPDRHRGPPSPPPALPGTLAGMRAHDLGPRPASGISQADVDPRRGGDEELGHTPCCPDRRYEEAGKQPLAFPILIGTMG
jgi:hypothetical protein